MFFQSKISLVSCTKLQTIMSFHVLMNTENRSYKGYTLTNKQLQNTQQYLIKRIVLFIASWNGIL